MSAEFTRCCLCYRLTRDENLRFGYCPDCILPEPDGLPHDNQVQMDILRDIAAERRRQDDRWGFRDTRSDELMLTLTVEELGECARAMQPDNDDAGDLDAELLQTAALVVQWLELRRRRKASNKMEQ